MISHKNSKQITKTCVQRPDRLFIIVNKNKPFLLKKHVFKDMHDISIKKPSNIKKTKLSRLTIIKQHCNKDL